MTQALREDREAVHQEQYGPSVEGGALIGEEMILAPPAGR